MLDRFPGLTDRAAFVRTNGTKGPWEVKDPERLLEEFNRSKFPPDVGLRVRSCAALKSCQKVHGAEKMADEINLLSTGLLKIMARTLPPPAASGHREDFRFVRRILAGAVHGR